MAVYLLCIGPDAEYRARHYCGTAKDERLDARLGEHRRGDRSCAALTRAWRELGFAFAVARIWRARSQRTEEAIKASGNLATFCPRCAARPRSVRSIRMRDGAYWLRQAAKHGKGLSLRTIRRGRPYAGRRRPPEPSIQLDTRGAYDELGDPLF